MPAPIVSIQARTYSPRIATPVVRVELCLEPLSTQATPPASTAANPPTIAPAILTPTQTPTPAGDDLAHAFMSMAETELLETLLGSVRRWEHHNDLEGSSRHTVGAGDVIAVQVNWPHHTHEISLEAEASNGRAKIVLISVTDGRIERHSFSAGHKNYLSLGPDGFSSHPDKLYLVLTGQQSGTDVDVLTDYFPE